MLRVAHFSRYLGTAGLESMILELCRARDTERYACSVASFQDDGAAEGLRRAGARVHMGPDAFRRAAAEADLINVHLCEFRYSEELLPIVRETGRPWVATLHDRICFPNLPAVAICTSRNCRELQQPGVRCVTIPNAVDVERFATRHRMPRAEVVITRVCRSAKCAPYFWEVVGKVLERYPQARFRIAGNVRPCRHPSERVEFLGVSQDIPALLADTDIFLYTPFPAVGSMDLVTLEASAAGVPCVVSDVSVVREGVEQGRNGFRTPFGDVDAAAEAVGRLIQDPALRVRMGHEAARMAREHFDIRRAARQYEAVYDGVLAAWAAGRRPREAAAA